MVFRWLQNGAPCRSTPSPGAGNPGTGQKEMWANFMGSPSAQFVWAVPQDGIAAPVDFNAIGLRVPAQPLERHGDLARRLAR